MTRATLLRGGLGLGLVAAVALGAGATGRLGAAAAGPGEGASDTAPPATEAVSERTLTIEETLEGTLGYTGAEQVLNGLAGTLTRLPALGSTLVRGDTLYEVDGRRRPVLMYGARPAWRGFDPDMSNGGDVQQLEENLEALGYGRRGFKVDRHWTSATTAAVKRWQRDNGMTADGTIDPGEIVFVPGAIRVTERPVELGAQVGPGQPVLRGTSDRQVVTVDLAADDGELLALDDSVTVELPDGGTVAGTVTSIGTIAEAGTDQFGAPSTPTIEVTITPALPDGPTAWQQAPVSIRIVLETRAAVLAVPVGALVALLEGGYAVERVAADGTTALVAVELGLFQDGWVEVRTDVLQAGDRVAVPA